MDKDKKRDNIVKESMCRAVYCFGTARIVEKKLKWLKRADKIIKFLGLVLPLSVGSYVIATVQSETVTPYLLNVAGILSFLQLIAILWSLIDNWNIKQDNYLESATKNMDLFTSFSEIKDRYDENDRKYSIKYKETKKQDDIQRMKDNKIDFSDRERRYGMRHGLFQFQLECNCCSKIPSINKPSNCDVCGL